MSGTRCTRCHEEVFGLVRTDDDIHVCKDIAKRLARRERQVQAILPMLECYEVPSVRRRVAEMIVAKLAGLGVADD